MPRLLPCQQAAKRNMMQKTKVAIIGLGTVGQGVARLLLDHGDRTARHAGRTLWLEKCVVRDLAKARVVPAEAVFPSAEGPVVYRKTWLGWAPQRVEVGRRNNEWIEVKGIATGDRVARIDLGARARRAGSSG